MSLSAFVAFLQTALMLLIAAQGPNIPQSLRDQAIQVANQAIAAATVMLSNSSATLSTTTTKSAPSQSTSPAATTTVPATIIGTSSSIFAPVVSTISNTTIDEDLSAIDVLLGKFDADRDRVDATLLSQ